MRKIVIEVKGKEYAFALDRFEVIRGEKQGMALRMAVDMPFNQVQNLWTVGLHKFQPSLNSKQCFDLWDYYIEEGGDTADVVNFLMEEYESFSQTTQSNLEETKKKKARIEVI